MENYTFRLKPGHDLFDSIQAFTDEMKIEAGCVISGVGSLKRAIKKTASITKKA